MALRVCPALVFITFLKVGFGSMFEISAMFFMWFAIWVCWREWLLLEEELSIFEQLVRVKHNPPDTS